MHALSEYVDLDLLSEPQSLLVMGFALGMLLAFFGFVAAIRKPDRAIRRMVAQKAISSGDRGDAAILKGVDATPTGFMKSFIPSDEKTRTELQVLLARAGFNGAYAVRQYYLIRLLLGIISPIVTLVLVLSVRSGALPVPGVVQLFLNQFVDSQIMLGLVAMIVVGFFGPSIWVRSRANERSRKISEGFPNALDLLQISTEAGLGFDAALIRIGNELAVTAPEISEEFLLAEREIHAGRTRERALLDMGARTGVDEVTAFANAVNQSIRYGTSLSHTLITYAKEMRLERELKAQEKANRLPVQLSAVMASLMLPALLLLTLGPVLIRYLDFAAR